MDLWKVVWVLPVSYLSSTCNKCHSHVVFVKIRHSAWVNSCVQAVAFTLSVLGEPLDMSGPPSFCRLGSNGLHHAFQSVFAMPGIQHHTKRAVILGSHLATELQRKE